MISKISPNVLGDGYKYIQKLLLYVEMIKMSFFLHIVYDFLKLKFLWNKDTLGRWDSSNPGLSIAGIDCSEPLSYGGIENNLFPTKLTNQIQKTSTDYIELYI